MRALLADRAILEERALNLRWYRAVIPAVLRSFGSCAPISYFFNKESYSMTIWKITLS